MILTFIGLCVICVTCYLSIATIVRAWLEVTKVENTLNGATIITKDPEDTEQSKKSGEPPINFGEVIAEINATIGGIDYGEETSR